MRSIKFNLSTPNLNAWDGAVFLSEAYLTMRLKANQVLERLPDTLPSARRATCQALFWGALRHGHRIRHALQPFVQGKLRARIEAIFLVAGYEMLASTSSKHPQIVHHAVERGKRLATMAETRRLNAVLRKLPEALSITHPSNRPDVYFSHPRWLFKRWNQAFGPPTTIALMKWNQAIPAIYLKRYDHSTEPVKGLIATEWDQFYRVADDVSWQQDLYPVLNQGNAYIKDPSTRLAPELLAPQKGQTVLDLCAAPGGKAYDLAHLMQLEGHIVAVDLPGERIQRLRDNLHNLATDTLRCTILESDLLELTEHTFTQAQLPIEYDAVMLDAPCSNTGVIQRRTDVKWRLRGNTAIRHCAERQLQLLTAAARWVKPEGHMVYSTCSIEADENKQVVDAFLQSAAGTRFTLNNSIISLPWETGHDGASAFLLIAKKPA